MTLQSMDLVVTRSSLFPNTLVILSGILMKSSLCSLGIRLDLRYNILSHKMVSSTVWYVSYYGTYVSLMVMYGLPRFRSFANK